MLDALEVDCERVNRAVQAAGCQAGPFHPIEVLCFSPSRSLSRMAFELRQFDPDSSG
ncbi:MAG: hypothetical protein AMXMBFR33_73470 [Candidatus Xenobia bacterium]